MQKERELAAIYQRTRNANAMATVPSTQATDVPTDVPATATPAQAIDAAATALPASNTQGTEMQYSVLDHPPATEAMTMDPQQPLVVQSPRSTHTVSSNSATAGPSRHTAETPDQSYVHQPNSRQTNWGKLKEQAQKDRSKRREVLIAVNPDARICCRRDSNKKNHQTTTTTERYDSDSSDEDKGDDDANDNSSEDDDHNDITHISKKELRDMVLAAAKTALSMSKRSTRKVHRGNEAKRTKKTTLQKEREKDAGWERQIFCVSSLGFEVTSTNYQATGLRS